MKNRSKTEPISRTRGRLFALALAGMLSCTGIAAADELPMIEGQADAISAQGQAALASILSDIRVEARERLDRELLAAKERVQPREQVAEKKRIEPRIGPCDLPMQENGCPFNCYHDFSIGGVSWVSLVD